MKSQQKVAIMTGASSGLGQALAESLAKAGMTVVLVARNKEKLELVAEGIRKEKGVAEAKVADVTKPREITALVAEVVKDHGRIDVLVNNAGWATKKMLIEETPDEDYERYMKTNTDSVFHFMKAVLPRMKKQKGGVIVNIASGAAKRGHGELAAYSASKFAVLGLTQAAGWELQDSGVSCVAVCPGGIDTPMRKELFGAEDAGRQQKPAEVASIILDVVTGKIKVPNGGDISIRRGKVTKIEDPLGA